MSNVMKDLINILMRIFWMLQDLTVSLWNFLTKPIRVLGHDFVPLWGLPVVIGVLLVAYIIKRVVPMV